jgi:preprotein translocase subunit Sec61beta
MIRNFFIPKAFISTPSKNQKVKKVSRKEKSMMPQSSAGLTRYFGQSKEGIKIKPEHVLIACTVLIVLEMLIKFIG